jgi:ParB family chromosome partitioning protein
MTTNSSDLGLEGLGELSSLLSEKQQEGSPLEVDLNLIDEDPEQPRVTFNKNTLTELAKSIVKSGVKTPISLRNGDGGRFIINHGARRYRASKIAERATIPAFIDNTHTKADQVVENIHRDNLTPVEIATYIDEQISLGKKKKDIAEEIGKSSAFISQHVVLLALPEDIQFLLNPSVCNDVTVIYEFSKEYKHNPKEVVEWLRSNQGDLNRANIRLFKEYIRSLNSSESSEGQVAEGDESRQGAFEFTLETGQEPNEKKPTSDLGETGQEEGEESSVTSSHVDEMDGDKVQPSKPTKDKSGQEMPEFYKPEECQIIVAYGNDNCRIVLDRKSKTEGWCWVEGKDGKQIEVDMSGADFVSLSFLSGK